MNSLSVCRGLIVLLVASLGILISFFAYPRIEFVATHLGASREDILLSSGTRDWVNFNRELYMGPALQLRELTERDATFVFASIFPAGYAYRFLYPRGLVFAYTREAFERSIEEHRSRNVYVVIRKSYFSSRYLQGLSYQELTGGWRLARLRPLGKVTIAEREE